MSKTERVSVEFTIPTVEPDPHDQLEACRREVERLREQVRGLEIALRKANAT